MGLFGRKKKVNCISCKTELDLNEARVVSGQYFCPACDIRRKAAAARAAQEATAPAPQPKPTASTGSDTMHPAIAAIKKTFDASDFHCTVRQREEDGWELVAGVKGKHSSYQIKYIGRGSDHDVAIRVFALANVPKGREQAACRLLNSLQYNYRYLRFTLDKDNDVNLGYDLPRDTDPESVGPICKEMLLRIMSIVDDIYPELMKAIWA